VVSQYDVETTVLIVGGGPSGLTAALLLTRLGIPYHLVERRPGPQRAPAAHVVNARTFEIWRQAGVDIGALFAAAKDPRDAGAVYWVSHLGGEVLGQLPFERQGDDMLAITPTPLRNLSQHRLEPLLLDALRTTGPGPHYGHRWESAEQDADGVTSRIRDAEAGRVYTVRSRYVIGADGAGSPVRKSLGIAMEGPDRLQSFVMIHFEADLRDVVSAHPGVIYWVTDPSCAGTFVAHDIDREWVFMHAWDPDRELLGDYTVERCEALVRRAIAPPDVSIALRTISSWVMTSQLAERYREGRIFLAGDAAHRFPPTGGLGLNTGVQDVHNLVWKLAAVEHGWAAPPVLETYEQERRPVAAYNAEQSLRNAARMLEVFQTIDGGEGGGDAAQRFAAMLTDGAHRARVAAAIADQAEHFDLLGLHLGYAYAEGALAADGTPPPANDNPVRDFIPSSRPGARLPHGWVEFDGERVSTLDLIALDRLTLLVGAAGDAWIEVGRQIDCPMRILQVGSDVEDANEWWQEVADMRPGGAILVRPDQHVAFRSQADGVDVTAALSGGVAAARMAETMSRSAPRPS